MKRLTLLFTLVLCLCAAAVTAPRVRAADDAQQAAEALNKLGLFLGTGTTSDGKPIYELDRVPTRNQAVIMLVRLLGKEDEARKGRWTIPFRDVDDGSYMAPYIGYAYANGLTKGTTATTYSGTTPVTRNQYLLFLMRAMGYADNFAYDMVDENGKTVRVEMSPSDAADMADLLGILDGTDAGHFTRGDVALLSYRALDTYMCYLKPDLQTLREALNLGASPKIRDRPIPLEAPSKPVNVETGSLDDIRTKYIQPGNPIYQEIPLSEGTLLYAAWAGTPHGTIHLLLHAYDDGRFLRLPIPVNNNWGQTIAPKNLAYDAATDTVTYEEELSEDLAWFALVGRTGLRKAGLYRYTYHPASHTASVSEIPPSESADLYVTVDDCLRRITNIYQGAQQVPVTSENVTFRVMGQWGLTAAERDYLPAPPAGSETRMVWDILAIAEGKPSGVKTADSQKHTNIILLADAKTGETLYLKEEPMIREDSSLYRPEWQVIKAWQDAQTGIAPPSVLFGRLLLRRELADHADQFPNGNVPPVPAGQEEQVVRLMRVIVGGNITLPNGAKISSAMVTLVFDGKSGELLFDAWQEYEEILPQNSK